MCSMEQVDSTGKLMEGSIANIAIVDATGVLRTPKYVDAIFMNATVQ